MKIRKNWIVMLAAVLLVGICGGTACTASSAASVSLNEKQRYVYAYITSIAGNEISYMEVEESVAMALRGEEMTEADTEKAQDEEKMSAERGERPDMNNMPSRDKGEQPDKGGMPNMKDMAETTSITTYIPVGTPVYTTADVKTTFSRLASGDFVKILVETNEAGEDVIEQIWMLQ